MTERKFNPTNALGEQLASMDRQELCRLVVELCRSIVEENGALAYRGGVYPENISRDADGALAVGPGRLSDWDGQELQFIPPELYWDGETVPAGDVYSLGLLLYYGLSGGKLPLEGESPNARIGRMSGQRITAPTGAGVRLGEIVEKACSFQASDRFASAKELGVMLESCLDNKYISDNVGEELFKKGEDELSEVERMMLAIIDGAPAEEILPAEEPVQDVPEEPEPLQEMSEDEAAEMLLGGQSAVESQTPEEEVTVAELVKTYFGVTEPEEATQEAAPILRLPEDDEAEDVRVYEPSHEKKDHVPIPILTEEKNPELAPIVPNRRYSVPKPRTEEQNRQIAENVKKRRTRPIGVVLILCSLLIFAALLANRYLRNYEFEDEGQGRAISMPSVDENAISTGNTFVSADDLERQETTQRQSYYQIFAGDFSWTEAKNACTEVGGTLVVINTQDEFTMVTQLAQQSAVQGVWVGCHRENGFLQWETTEPVGMMTWADGEPSYTDSRDGAAEDYVMLWNTGNGWAYIDCRNDPVFADPGIYSGKIGYVCEFENG